DAAHAVGLVAGRRVRDDLDAVEGAGREAAEVGGEEVARDRRRPAVDEDGDVLDAAEAHVAVDVDLDGGDGLEGVGGRAAGDGRVVGDAVDRPVDLDLDLLAAARHLDALQRHGVGHEGDGAEVHGPPAAPDLDRLDDLRRVADERDDDAVRPGPDALDAEGALGVRDGAGVERGVGRAPRPGQPPHGDGGRGQPLARGVVYDAA